MMLCPVCRTLIAALHDHRCAASPGTVRARSGNRDPLEYQQRKWLSKAKDTCRTCEHWGHRDNRTGCLIAPNKPCDIEIYQILGKPCFDDPPRYGERPKYIQFPDFHWDGEGGNLAVCTVVAGEKAEELATYTLPQMSRFAENWGAELVVLSGDQFPLWPMANKFRVEGVAEQFNRTFYLDIDVWIHDHCPSPFDHLPEGKVGLFNEYMFDHDFYIRDLTMFGRLDLLKKETSFNLGVAMLDRQHSAMWHPPSRAKEVTHTTEQTHNQINLYDLGFDIHSMPAQWNAIWVWDQRYREKDWYDKTWWDEAYIWHLAGCPHETRIEILSALTSTRA
ncbi:MAG: hypothetical protein KDB00_05980 [Planctomycetales bacterium]|nr:hypothetical protein [Planctomycetales bacterium]